MSRDRLFTGLWALGVGGPFLLIGLLAAIQMVRLMAGGIRTRAKIVAYETSSDGEARYPVVEFRDRGGVVRRVQLAAGVPTGKDGLAEIVYHRGNPNLARGTSFVHTWLVPLVGIALGGGLVLLGVLVLLGLTPEE
jgi:hypothetical protein